MTSNFASSIDSNNDSQINKGVGSFMKTLRSHFNKYYFEDYYTGSIYNDENTITYFPFTPKELKEQKLKIAIVYNYQKLRFEIWLAGQNKQIQKKYWEIFKDSNWDKYHVPQTISDGFSIVDDILIEKPNFDNFDNLLDQLESKSLRFIKGILEVF